MSFATLLPHGLFCRVRPAVALLVFGAVVGVVLAAAPPASSQNTFTVNSTDDAPDANLSDDVCRTSEGACTLRAALQQANATPNDGGAPDVITFGGLPQDPPSIRPATELPFLREAAFVDGFTAPGYTDTPVVQLDGSAIDAPRADGLVVADGAAGSTIRGLGIGAFPDHGLQLNRGSNILEDNLVGTNADGDDLGNGDDGIHALFGNGNTIRGNTVGFNGDDGIQFDQDSENNVVQGNFVGTDAAGRALGNGDAGLTLLSTDNRIGGTAGEDANVIGFNGTNDAESGDGIVVGTGGNVIEGNFIGTNVGGDDLGNQLDGIRFFEGSGNTVRDNTIGFNDDDGVQLNSAASDNTFTGNFIGTNADGDDLGNGSEGITIFASGTQVGTLDAPNVIAFNDDEGVYVSDTFDKADGNAIRGNRIYDNGSIGINLMGGNRNDSLDLDDGPNRLQNFPEISASDYDPGTDEVTATYRVPSTPDSSEADSTDGPAAYPLTVDFYRADASGNEGAAHLGTDTYTAEDYDGGCSTPPCSTSITFTPAAPVRRSDDLLATATDADGNTSQFTAAASPLPVELLTPFDGIADGSDVLLRWETAGETNNEGFVIKQKRGGVFERIGYRQGAGTTPQGRAYDFRVRDVDAGHYTFRLVQVDRDDTRRAIGETTVEVRSDEAFVLRAPYPNPFTTQAKVSFSVPEGQSARVDLLDARGRRVAVLHDGPAPNGRLHRLTIDASQLASGLYLIRLRAGGRERTQTLPLIR